MAVVGVAVAVRLGRLDSVVARLSKHWEIRESGQLRQATHYVPSPQSLAAAGAAAQRCFAGSGPLESRAMGRAHVIGSPANIVFLTTAAMLIAAMGSGCRFIPRTGPVPQELAAARRLCNEGLSAADKQDLMRAEGLLEQAVKRCPTDIDSRRHYADVLWKRGERMEAVTQVAEALRLSPEDVGLCIDGGRMYMDLGLLDDADRLANQAIKRSSRSAAAWHLHGQVALARGQALDALADFHRSLAIAADDRDVLLDTAEVYRRLNRPQRALATLAILGETYGPDQSPANLLALEGMAQEALGRPSDAIESYRHAIGKGEAGPDITARLAALEQSAGTDEKTAVAARSNESSVRE